MDESSLEKRDQQPSLTKKPAPAAEPQLRASDADRDRIADILREALAEGRLDADEHAERVEQVYRARTVADLEPLVRDLPAGRDAHGPRRASPQVGAVTPHSDAPAGGENLVAVFGGATRKGRWRVGRRTTATAIFGGVDIDLTEAVFEQQEIRINATAIFGGVDIKVPENVSLRGSGIGIFGGFDVKTYEAPDPGAPVVIVGGFAMFGGVDAKPKRGKRLRDLRGRKRPELGD
ncbi:DUF1707 SHOCT-like domain-containing protein [Streptomyces meridianus]|uniref:DUF1707 domain-containing protein n=1 Tax=Streptomyces meridianus TaxID=2938945 RepID=A0ABT0X134_9ACTN|nr:DUF1707 domain-containing protein [Streptomyces meridianus]MCM2576265.1 DUF1707 domain-containing protein [Streptomyces meridianus]